MNNYLKMNYYYLFDFRLYQRPSVLIGGYKFLALFCCGMSAVEWFDRGRGRGIRGRLRAGLKGGGDW
jgi:hypothetical protein